MELYQLYKDLDLGTEIRKWRLHWIGHVERTEESRIPIKLIHSNSEGQRRTGRPRKWWVEDVEEDLRKMGIGLAKKSKGEKEWADVIKEAKVLQGL
jgi:hypothetical protein